MSAPTLPEVKLNIRTQTALLPEIPEGDVFFCYEVSGPKIVDRIFPPEDRTPAVKFAEAFGETSTVAPIAGRSPYDRAALFGIPAEFAAKPAPKVNQLVTVGGKRGRVWGVTFDWMMNPTSITVRVNNRSVTVPAAEVQQ